jgi:hypothetical protein
VPDILYTGQRIAKTIRLAAAQQKAVYFETSITVSRIDIAKGALHRGEIVIRGVKIFSNALGSTPDEA